MELTNIRKTGLWTNSRKNEYILEGDTIWKIAEREAKNNKYYENKDIRNIVKEIKDINNINNEVLHIGDKINIPTY